VPDAKLWLRRRRGLSKVRSCQPLRTLTYVQTYSWRLYGSFICRRAQRPLWPIVCLLLGICGLLALISFQGSQVWHLRSTFFGEPVDAALRLRAKCHSRDLGKHARCTCPLCTFPRAHSVHVRARARDGGSLVVVGRHCTREQVQPGADGAVQDLNLQRCAPTRTHICCEARGLRFRTLGLLQARG
jgi:hypothetical protein